MAVRHFENDYFNSLFALAYFDILVVYYNRASYRINIYLILRKYTMDTWSYR